MGYLADKSPLIGHLAGPIRRLKPLGAQRQEKCGPNHLTREGLHATTPESVVAALIVYLVMVLFDELVDELAHMSLTKRDHATETLLFDRTDPGRHSPTGVILQ